MNLVLALIAGAMAKATVPVLAAQHSKDDDSNKAAHTLSVVLTVTLVVLGLGSLIMALAASSVVVTVLAPGFKGAQADLAASLTRIVLIATVLISGTNLLAAAAEAHRRFFWSAMQGVPFNLIMIVAAVVFGPRYGVYALAVGFVVGSAARLLCQLLPIRALGLRLRASLDLKDPGFRIDRKVDSATAARQRTRQRQYHGRSGRRLDGGRGNHLGVELRLADHLARRDLARLVAADRAVSRIRCRGGYPRSR